MSQSGQREINQWPGFSWWDMCGWCLDERHEKCCWEGCACKCKPRRWLRFRNWLKTLRKQEAK